MASTSRRTAASVEADQLPVVLHDPAVDDTVCTSPRWAWKATWPYGLSSGNETGESSFLIRTTSAFLPGSRLPRSSRPSAWAPPRVAQSTTCSARRRQRGDGVALDVGLEVLARPVGAERRPHRGEQVAAPPHAGVHRQRHRDVVLPHLPGRRVALAGALLGLRGDRDRAAGGRDPLVGVGAQRRRVHVDGLRGREAVLVHQPDAVVVRRAPDAGVRGHREAEVAGHLERRLLRERRVAGDVEGQLEAEHVAGAGTASLEEVADGRVGGPLPRAGLDVAVGQHEPARHRLQRVDRGVGVVDGLQPVRPVDGGGDAGLERLPRPRAGCRRGCPRVGTSCRARGSTRRSTASGSSRRRTPRIAVCHMCRWVSIIPGITMPPDASTSRVPSGDVEARTDRLDPVADDQDVAVGVDRVAVVHGEHGAAAEDRTDRVGHGSLLSGTSCPLSGQLVAPVCARQLSRVNRLDALA